MIAKRKTVLVDIDGTVSINEGRRGFYEWDKVHLDAPNQPIIDLVNTMFEDYAEIIFVTGRDAICEQATREWLSEHFYWFNKESKVYMRPIGDNREDTIVKKEIYENKIEPRCDVAFVLDDRSCVVDMWRSLGLTCLQVAPGVF